MKITIGDKYHREGDNYVEQLEIVGLDAIDEPLPNGETVVPKNGDSHIEVRIINNITAEYFHTTISLHNLANRWQEGTADL
jgi:hypothetical protein